MIDFIFNSDTGKVTIGESTRQHQQDILVMGVGWHKFKPTHGVGIADYLGDETSITELKSAIRREFERDGMNVKTIDFQPNGKIEIDANY